MSNSSDDLKTLPLTAYELNSGAAIIRRAPSTREWMDKTAQRYAYRCLPLVIANQQGWQILSPFGFSATWNGSKAKEGVTFTFDDEPSNLVSSHFGSGIITFSIAYIFQTPEGHNLWTRGPVNAPKDGIAPLDGVIETDWSPYTFTMNWQITRSGHPVRFEAGEPICQILPFPRHYLETFEPRIQPIANNKPLLDQYTRWNQSRSSFIKDLATEGSKAREEQWQRTYMHGRDQDGRQFSEHQTKLSLNEFHRDTQEK